MDLKAFLIPPATEMFGSLSGEILSNTELTMIAMTTDRQPLHHFHSEKPGEADS